MPFIYDYFWAIVSFATLMIPVFLDPQLIGMQELSTKSCPNIKLNIFGEDYDCSGDNAIDFVSSPTLHIPLVILFIGCWMLSRCKVLEGFDRHLAIWHLSNATCWSFAFDLLSGYFHIQPRIRELYIVMDETHLDLKLRSSVDILYLTEMFFHVPFSFVVFWAYLSGWKCLRQLETFLCGVQMMGTVGYYGPEMLRGGDNYPGYDNIMLYLNFGFASVWIILPTLIVLRNCSLWGDIDGSESIKKSV